MIQCFQAGVGQTLASFGRPPVFFIGSCGRILERHLQSHRKTAMQVSDLCRTHGQVCLASRLGWITLLGLEVSI